MPKNEVWSIHYLACSYKRDYGVARHETFTATGDQDAKEKVLRLTQKFIRRLQFIKHLRRRDRFIHILAGPYIKYDPNEEQNLCDGNRMLRIKGTYSNRRILRVRDPDVALVQGYGPKQIAELTGQRAPRTTP